MQHPSQPSDEREVDRLPAGRGGRWVAFLVLAVFFGALYGTAAIDTLVPVPRPEPVGEELLVEEARRRNARFLDGSLAALVERDQRLTSRVRREVLPYYSLALYAIFSAGNEHVIVGRDGWLFSPPRVTPPEVDDAELAGLTGALFKAVDRRLATLGVERTVYLPIPRKAVVGEEFLPPGVDSRPELDSLVVDAMIAKGCEVVDLREALADRAPEEIYYRTDTHWTPGAARLAAEALARHVGRGGEGPPRLGELEVTPGGDRTCHHDLLASLGIGKNLAELGWLDLRPPAAVEVLLPEDVGAALENPRARTSAALAGTSMSRWHHLARILTHYLGEPVWDGARAAMALLGTTDRLLDLRGADGVPRLLFVEVPLHQISHNCRAGEPIYFGPRAMQLLAGHPPRSSLAIPGPPAPWRRYRMIRRELEAGQGVRLFGVPAGMLAHTGEGVVTLHLEGAVEGAPVELAVLHANHRMELRVPAGTLDLFLPLLAAGATAGEIEVTALSRAPATVRIEVVTPVLEAPPESFLPLLPGPGTLAERVRVPSAPARLGRGSALLLTTGAGVDPEGGVELVVRARDPGGEVRGIRRHFEGLRPGARVAIDLGPLAGADLLGIELVADGVASGKSPLGRSALVNPVP